MSKSTFIGMSKKVATVLCFVFVCLLMLSFGTITTEAEAVYPVAPSNVTATTVDSSKIQITWDNSIDADFIQVWRTTKVDAEQKDYVCIGIYNAEDGTSTSKLLSANTTYYYKLRAYNKIDGKSYYSGYSTIVSAKTSSLATPGSVKATSQSVTEVKVSWAKPKDTDFIQVWRTTKANAEQNDYVCIGIYNAGDESCISKLLKPNTTYYYKVRGYQKRNGKTVYSGYSAVVSAKTRAINPPTNVIATAMNSSMVRLEWDANDDIDFVQVWRTNKANAEQKDYVCIGIYNASDEVSVSKLLNNNTKYYYKLRGYKKINGTNYYSGYSTIVNATTWKWLNIDNRLIVKEGYTLWNSYDVYVVKNISKKPLWVHIESTAYDDEGDAIGILDTYYGYLDPSVTGMIPVFYDDIDTGGLAIDHVECMVEIEDINEVNSDFSVSNVTLSAVKNDYGCVITAKNNGSTPVIDPGAGAIFFDNGEVVGFWYDYISDSEGELKAGLKRSAQLYCDEPFNYFETYFVW